MAGKSNKKLNNLRSFPSISSVLEDETLLPIIESWSFQLVSKEVKRVASELKKDNSKAGKSISKDDILSEIIGLFKRYSRELIQPVINGTGVILHTNLGRAPLSPVAYEGLSEAITGYSNLEFNLIEGKRSNRSHMPGLLLAALSGAESGMAVNNNAAAVYLTVANIAGPGKEVIISRGQLVQIGGGFRIPEIIERSGATLKEIGTTNKTSITDYQKAINKNTALILIVHKSNFVQKGFTEEPEPSRIAEIAKAKKVSVCFDLGSGFPEKNDLPRYIDEPTIQSAVRTGADLVCFSGDKLLGGPQAGLIIGKKKIIASLLKDPIYRAFRLDKLALGLLERTLLAHLNGQKAPCWEMASIPIAELSKRADEIISSVNSDKIHSIELKSSFGGGSLPEYEFDSIGLKVDGNPQILSRKLMDFTPAVVCRSVSDGILIDLRTVLPEQLTILIDAIKSCL